jgi:hypothetical protein
MRDANAAYQGTDAHALSLDRARSEAACGGLLLLPNYYPEPGSRPDFWSFGNAQRQRSNLSRNISALRFRWRRRKRNK